MLKKCWEGMAIAEEIAKFDIMSYWVAKIQLTNNRRTLYDMLSELFSGTNEMWFNKRVRITIEEINHEGEEKRFEFAKALYDKFH